MLGQDVTVHLLQASWEALGQSLNLNGRGLFEIAQDLVAEEPCIEEKAL